MTWILRFYITVKQKNLTGHNRARSLEVQYCGILTRNRDGVGVGVGRQNRIQLDR